MADRVMTDRVVADHRLSQVSTASSTNSKRAKAHIGPWQLGRTLGRGSSGRVRLAKHMETGKLAAVKIVPKAQIMDQASTSLHKASESYGIEREVIIMKLIEHPNIMALYDVWENKGELYLVLEYIEGGELFDYLISRGRLSEREAIHYFRQICYGVDYCHRFNICHRDLKPENLLLDKHRNIKIADFGMAALESNGRLLETSCGSPHYASPEIVTGKTYHGAPSDIWSCGIILFALLSGHLPFDDDNIRQLLLKVQAGRFDMPASLSPEARDLISKMLVVDPMQRITMHDILRHPLLQKYPPRRVPAENMDRKMPTLDVSQPIEHVDREILRNLLTLWHYDTKDTLISRLRAAEPNSEKTFYSLLLRFRQRHGLASRESLPRNKSVASIRSIRSSKSVRSVASLNSKSGSMKSLRSVRSNRSGRSFLSSRRTRRSPMKQLANANRASANNNSNGGGPSSKVSTSQNAAGATLSTAGSSTATLATAAGAGASKTGPHSRSKPNNEENADVFAQLLDEAFNRRSVESTCSTIPSQNRSSQSGDLEDVTPQARSNTDVTTPDRGYADRAYAERGYADRTYAERAYADRTYTATAAPSRTARNENLAAGSGNVDPSLNIGYHAPIPPVSSAGSAASPPFSPVTPTAALETDKRILSEPAQSYSLDFDLTGQAYSAAVPQQSAHNYLLPMIFEEDRFADAIEEEVELKVYKRGGRRQSRIPEYSNLISGNSASMAAGVSGTQAGDNSQLRITNLVAGESFLSYQPSPAAAAIKAPVRPAPRAPSGPRSMPERKPVPIYVEPQVVSESASRPPVTEREPLATLSPADLRRPRPAASAARDETQPKSSAGGSSNAARQSNAREPLSTPAAQEKTQIQVPKRGAKPQNQTEPTKEKHRSSWIRRLTPRIVSRKSSKEEPASNNKPSKTRAESANQPAKVNEFIDKENLLAHRQKTAVGSQKPQPPQQRQTVSAAQLQRNPPSRRNAPAVSEEPRQNWFMKLLTSSTQTSSRTFMSTCQPIELRAIILEVLNEWMPYGLALYSDGSRGEPIVVAILQNNSLRLKSARIGIDIKASSTPVATARVVHQKGSRSSFMTFTNELERRLGEINVLGVDY